MSNKTFADDLKLAQKVIELAMANDLRVVTAESLTGGLLAASIINVPGASKVFLGGVVAYDTRLKSSLLGVDPKLLRLSGPVNRETATQMAFGVVAACKVDHLRVIGVSTTGVAGPDADPQTGQLPGEVYLGIALGEESETVLLNLVGSRDSIREQTVTAALKLLLSKLESL